MNHNCLSHWFPKLQSAGLPAATEPRSRVSLAHTCKLNSLLYSLVAAAVWGRYRFVAGAGRTPDQPGGDPLYTGTPGGLKVKLDALEHLIKQWRPTWQTLRALGNSRMIKSSYLWLFAVPIVARFCEKFPDTLRVPLFDTSIDVSLRLPFRWTVLFAMSVSFAAGQFLYAVFCPSIIKSYASFNEFRARHKGNRKLTLLMQEMPLTSLPSDLRGEIDIGRHPADEARASDAFDYCHEWYALKMPWVATISGLFFFAGGLLFLVLIGDSIISVWEMSLEPPVTPPLTQTN